MRTAFVCRETFRWSDADLQQVVNNAVYLTLFEQARYGYFKSLGILDGDAFPFLLGSTNLRFVRPGRVGMVVDVEARVVRLGHKSLDMSYRVACGSDTIADGGATLVWVDSGLRSTRIPDAVRVAIAAREDIGLGGGA